MEDRTLKPSDSDYPRRLKDRLGSEAPTLYARGHLEHLAQWSLAFFTADVEPPGVTRAVWDLFFPMLEFEMNVIGPWQSVNEGVLFRSALEKPWISLTLFTAKGLDRESWKSFVTARHRPPQDVFLQRPEFDRRAAAGELLLLSVSPPGHERQSREVILHRNRVACALADAVFLGGASRISREWSARHNRWIKKKQKTFALARWLSERRIPAFTAAHSANGDLFELGIPGLDPKSIGPFLERMGGKKPTVRATQSGAQVRQEAVSHVDRVDATPAPRKRTSRQLDLFRAVRKTKKA